jgi:asparagine synthase (glutamine-hydrolysing)
MCGLIFLYNNNLSTDNLLSRGRAATMSMTHRGPDDFGLQGESPWVTGHRRLAIIDLDASKQPMLDPSGRYVISFNGEIYNYQELRKELQTRWQFITNGDTEVILAGLICLGEDFIKRMEGMWALSFWDKTSQTLLLSRDRMGKKPLYYYNNNHSFACASELPALLQLLDSPPSEDPDSTADFFRYGYFLPGTTIYKGIYEVLPGHTLNWKPQQPIRSQAYWQLNPATTQKDKQQAYKLLRETMIDSVRKRMIADVEVGAFLSGGVDSSLVVSLMCKALSIKPKTFTIGFQEAEYDESAYARQIANSLGTEHYEEELNQWDRGLLLKLISEHIGQPFFDPSILPTAKVSALAAQHVKVALSGDGGDELFCGYQRYQARSIMRWFTRLPDVLKKNALKAIRLLPEPMAHHSRSILKKAHLFADIVSRQDAETPYIAPVLYNLENFQNLAPDIHQYGHTPPNLMMESRLDDIEQMMLADSLVYLPQDILLKVDRASMAYSLETRSPFLDTKVIETAFSMPRKWHCQRLSGKQSLKDAFRTYLPDNIWNRNKQGFAVPIHEWFRGELDQQLLILLESIDSPINTQFVLQMLDEHKKKRRDHGFRLWSIYTYLLWRQKI